MRRFSRCVLVLSLWTIFEIYGQRSALQSEEVGSETQAFVNAHIYVDAQTQLEHATLLIKNGKVVDVGLEVEIPPATPTIDLQARYVYPSFIDPSLSLCSCGSEGHEEDHPELRRKLRAVGFGAVLSCSAGGAEDGIFSLIDLSDRSLSTRLLLPQAVGAYSLRPVAELRQQLEDLSPRTELKKSLSYIIEVTQTEDALLADRIFKAHAKDLNVVLSGVVDAYLRPAELATSGRMLILSLNFPSSSALSKPEMIDQVSYSVLKHWEMAPAQAALLQKAQVPFAFTSKGLRKLDSFLDRVRISHRAGLPKAAALRALTAQPAAILGASGSLGALKAGFWANFFIASGDIFEEDSYIQKHYIRGLGYDVHNPQNLDFSGIYNLIIEDSLLKNSFELEVLEAGTSPRVELRGIEDDSLCYEAEFRYLDHRVELMFYPKDTTHQYTRLRGWREGLQLQGQGQGPDGRLLRWSATFSRTSSSDAQVSSPPLPKLGTMSYPFMAYGAERPERPSYLIQNATLWTNEAEGILSEYDLLIKDGLITAVAQDLSPPPWCGADRCERTAPYYGFD